MGARTTNKIVAYFRVSTKKQGHSGLGLEGQRAAVKAHASSVGATIIAEHTEIETGKIADRPQLAKALAQSKRTGATLCIAKLDRLSRNVAFIAAMMDSGVEFLACDNPNANRLTLHILASIAEHEARCISQRTKEALAAYKARGGQLGKPENLTHAARLKGAKRAGEVSRVRAASAYADLVPEMKAMRANGRTLVEIANALNVRGETTRRGLPWSHTAVLRLLRRAG